MNTTNIALAIVTAVCAIAAVITTTSYAYFKHRINKYNPTDSNTQLSQLHKKTIDYSINFTELILGSLLGKGSQGEVYRATWRGLPVAVKKIDTRVVEPEIIDEFIQETTIMKNLRHPNLTLFMGVSLQSPHLCIVTEIVSRGSLFDLIHDDTSALTFSRALRVAADVAVGMIYLHENQPQILHRDLKSLNILIDDNWRGKVADFGMSRLRSDTDASMTQCGSPLWMAPEMIKNTAYGAAADVYSFGVCLWEIYVRKIPYRELGLSPNNLVVKVVKENLRPAIPKTCPRAYARLMERCWHSDAEKRPTFQQILVILESFLQDSNIVNHKPNSTREAVARSENEVNDITEKLEIITDMGYKIDVNDIELIDDSTAQSGLDVVQEYNDSSEGENSNGGEPGKRPQRAFNNKVTPSESTISVTINSTSVMAAPSPTSRTTTTTTGAPHHVTRTSIYQLEQQEKEQLWEARKNVVLKQHDSIQLGSEVNSIRAGSMLKQRNLADQLSLASYKGKRVSVRRHVVDDKWVNITPEQRVVNDIAGEPDGKLWSTIRKASELRHPNIVLFMGAYRDTRTSGSSRPASAAASVTPPNKAAVVVVSEYMDRGNLADIIMDHSLVLDWNTSLNLLIDATQGLTYLHACQPTVIHQDLTLRRFYVDKNWRVKVADYGFVDLTAALNNTSLPPSVYTAPELLSKSTHTPTTASNVYSFGIVLWQIMIRKHPFDATVRFDDNFKARIVHEQYRPKWPAFVSTPFKQLVESMWQHDAAKRPSFDSVLDQLKAIRTIGPPRLQLDNRNATAYKKAQTVYAYRTKDALTVLKDWGQSVGKAGSVVVFSEPDDIYCMDADTFNKSYELADKSRSEYRKTGIVVAKCMEDTFAVKTAQGVEHGLAGDYLVQNDSNDQWSVEAQTFHKLYVKVR